MRITGGVHRSRYLVAPRGDRTRPTSDRVREALFSILAGYLDFEGAAVLDLYSGTGALAFEALSRGAGSAVLVERGKDALVALRANAASLGLGSQVRVVAQDVERAVASMAAEGARFRLLLADPPYADVPSGALGRALAPMGEGALVEDEAVVVVEHAAKDASPAFPALVLLAHRSYGDTALSLYRRATKTIPEASEQEDGRAGSAQER